MNPPAPLPLRPLLSPGAMRFYEWLLHVKPAVLGAALKRLFLVRRRVVDPPTGPRMWLDPGSVFGFLILKQSVYEPEMRRLVETVLRPGDTFVDVGANEGYFTICAARAGATVHAIEPQSRLQPVLQRNLALNPGAGERVQIHPLALSDRAEEVDLYLASTMNTGMTGVLKGSRSALLRQSTRAQTLDSLADEAGFKKARLMKVDCEGGEGKVMAGATRLLAAQAFDFIAMEYHPFAGTDGAQRCRTIHEQLLGAGYLLTKIADQCVYHLPGLEETLKELGTLRSGVGWES